jgi:hypothetical protein
MQAFAYKTVAHREAMRRTRAENWYREELFARFVPVASEGTWEGREPLIDKKTYGTKKFLNRE